jgi:hypothetical protein
MLDSNPWLCVNSLNAIAQLGLLKASHIWAYPKTMTGLTRFFTDTQNWHLQLRNFILLPRPQDYKVI